MSEQFAWHSYSKKVQKKIFDPRNFGSFTLADATERGMHLAKSEMGSLEEGNLLCLYLLVDPEDGTIVECKYKLFGDAILIAIAEATCDLLVSKNYEQARHITAELIEKELVDKGGRDSFEAGGRRHLNMAIDAIEEAALQCTSLPLPENYTTPIHEDNETSTAYPGWNSLTKEKKLQLIDELFSEEIRPYIELDEGGVKILDLTETHELHIAYEGACTSCYSAIGTTLNSIQHILQTKLYPSLTVVPSMDELTFG